MPVWRRLPLSASGTKTRPQAIAASAGCRRPLGSDIGLPEGAQAVRELFAGGWLSGSRPDVGAEPADLPGGDEGVQPCPLPDIPSVGRGERVEVVIGGAPEPPVHVVDLHQVPLARPHGDVIPVPEDDPAGRCLHQVAYVRVAMN